jgi:hypothetical protein
MGGWIDGALSCHVMSCRVVSCHGISCRSCRPVVVEMDVQSPSLCVCFGRHLVTEMGEGERGERELRAGKRDQEL